MSKKAWPKIVAFLALFWICIWIIWTWVLVIFWGWNSSEQENTEVKKEDLQKLIDQSKIKVETNKDVENKNIENKDVENVLKIATWTTK